MPEAAALSNYPVYTHFWDGIDGDGWCQDFATEKEAMEAHRKAIKDRKTLESRVRFYADEDSGKLIIRWTRGDKP